MLPVSYKIINMKTLCRNVYQSFIFKKEMFFLILAQSVVLIESAFLVLDKHTKLGLK